MERRRTSDGLMELRSMKGRKLERVREKQWGREEAAKEEGVHRWDASSTGQEQRRRGTGEGRRKRRDRES